VRKANARSSREAVVGPCQHHGQRTGTPPQQQGTQHSRALAARYRSLAACRAPLDDAGSAVRATGLRLEEAEDALVPCPFHDEWARGDVTDAAAQAAAFVPTTRTWSNSTCDLRFVFTQAPRATVPLFRADRARATRTRTRRGEQQSDPDAPHHPPDQVRLRRARDRRG